MGLDAAAKNLMLNALTAVAGFASLHTADPGGTGANEVAGGAPAYSREAIAWAAAAGGAVSQTGTAPQFDVPAGTTVGWVGLWSAAVAGTFYGAYPLGPAGTPKLFTADSGTDVFTAVGHGFADGNPVTLTDTVGNLPTGVAEGTIYFVRDSTTNTFKLAATLGGAAIDITAFGNGVVQRITAEVFGGQGTYTLSDFDITL